MWPSKADGSEGWGSGIVLPVLSAVLLLLAQPPFQFILLPFVALAPLAIALARVEGPRSAAWQGLTFGLVYWGVLLLWVPMVVAPRFSWAYPGYLAQVGLLSGLAALMAGTVFLLNRSWGLPLPLAFPLAWVAMEWLKAHFPLGLSFPWLGLGMTLSAWPELLGIAEWTGEAGVAFWLALVNGLLAVAIMPARETGVSRGAISPGGISPSAGWIGPPRGFRALRLLSMAGLVAIIPALLGIFRTRTLSLEPGPRVVVVGTGIPAALRLDPEEGSERALDQSEALLAGLAPGAADLVVLPEALVGIPLDGPSGRPYLERLQAMARQVRAPLLVGALGGARPDGEVDLPTNSAFLVAPENGLGARYDKSRLVPGMEWGGYEAGPAGSVISWADLTLGPLICYESIFGALTRRYGAAGADLLVNLTSDVWFGSPGEWPGKGFLAQHPTHLVMRAVETRMGVARAANGGVSLLLDPLGRSLTTPLPPGPGVAMADVPLRAGKTIFTRTGDLVGPLSLIWILLVLLRHAGRGGRSVGRRRIPGPPTG